MIAFLFTRNSQSGWLAGLQVRAVNAFEDSLMAGFWAICGRLSPDQASDLGYWLMSRIGPRIRKSRHVRTNIALARPEFSEAELDAHERDAWGGYGRVLAEYPHLPKIVGEEVDERIEFRGLEILEKAQANGRTVVFVPAHLANWEIPTVVAVQLGFPLTVVHSPLRNPSLAARLERLRSVLGCEYLSKHDGLRESLRRLRAGRWMAILPDVRIDAGHPLQMFGVEVPTTLVPARLALRTDSLLVPVHIVRTEQARFRVTILPAIEPDDSIEDERLRAADMMQRTNDYYTEWIRERPSQWLCIKRRTAKASQTDAD